MPHRPSRSADPLLNIEPHYSADISTARDEDVSDIRNNAMDFLESRGPSIIGDLHSSTLILAKVCISEAVTNPIKDKDVKPRKLEMRFSQGRFAVSVSDNGLLDPELAKNGGKMPENNEEAVSGRGLWIISEASESFGFRQTKPEPLIRSPRILGRALNRLATPTGKELWFILNAASDK